MLRLLRGLIKAIDAAELASMFVGSYLLVLLLAAPEHYHLSLNIYNRSIHNLPLYMWLVLITVVFSMQCVSIYVGWREFRRFIQFAVSCWWILLGGISLTDSPWLSPGPILFFLVALLSLYSFTQQQLVSS